MRCHCPHCEEETWMVHSERDNACVCPECLYRCYACQGTGTALTRDQVLSLRDNDALFADIREKIVSAVRTERAPRPLTFPCVFEKSFKRVEDAAAYLERLTSRGIGAEHPEDGILGRDAHTVRSTVRNMDEFIICI